MSTPAPAKADFRAWAEHIYYHCHATVDRLAYELHQYHYAGVEHTEGAGKLLDVLTQRVRRHGDARDYHNALCVILADLICDVRDNDPGAAFGERFGPLGFALITQLRHGEAGAAASARPDDPVTRNELVRFVSIFAPARMSEYLHDAGVPTHLPIIELLKEALPPPPTNLSTVIGVQHLFGSTRPLIEAIARGGVASEGVFLLGKPYSSNHETMWTLRHAHGYFVHEGSVEFTGDGEYHHEADRHLEELLNRVLRWMGSPSVCADSRAVLIDDGGRAIRLLHDPAYDSIRPRISCVEQTRRGIWELEDIDLKVPVVNVAESKAKLVHESPLIAESVKVELLTTLARLEEVGVPVARKALVVGFGAIGEAVADVLSDAGWQIGVFDAKPEKRDAAKAKGYTIEATLEGALPQYCEIIGCTGVGAVRMEHYPLLRDGAVLVSASSSDIEFESWHLRGQATLFSAPSRQVDQHNLVHERFGNRLLYLGDLDHPSHFLYLVRIRGRRVFLVNGGFPVNMNGAMDPIPAEKIQLTRSLLYAGAMQAARETRAGLHALDEDAQTLIIDAFLKQTDEDDR